MPSRILVVDDDATVCRLIADTLRRRGEEVVEAGAAEPALAHLRTTSFDLLITNLEMPGPSGLWLLEEAKRLWPDLPTIVVTGGVPEHGEVEALRLADDVVVKPFQLRALYERVRAVLGAREAGA